MTSNPPTSALYVIPQDAPASAGGYMAYGGAAELWSARNQEVLLAGPYETGKTIGALHKGNGLSVKYPGCRGLMIRKTYRSLVESACVTFENRVMATPLSDPRCAVRRVGGSNPTGYVYSNGSRIVLGGMDNPNKLLSSEWDWIYVNQAEELTLTEWASLTGRATGRAGNMPYGQVFGDANPGPPNHWALHRPSLRMIESRHEDNPTLFDPTTGLLTDRGRQTMAVLDALPGVLYLRGRLGKWVAAEGQVYEAFDKAVHLIDRFTIPPEWPRVWTIDWGYTNPFVWQNWALGPDRQMYLDQELYVTRTLVETAAAEIMRATEGQPEPTAIVCDHDAGDRATFEKHTGLRTVAAYKAIGAGIGAVQSRLGWKASDDKPAKAATLFILRDAPIRLDPALAAAHKPASTVEEFDLYVWPKAPDGKSLKEVPVDDFNHGMDGARYGVAYVDQIHRSSGGGDYNADYLDDEEDGTLLGDPAEWEF